MMRSMNNATPFQRLRIRHGFHTQRELATKIGASQALVCKADHGHVPRPRLVAEMAKALKSTDRKVTNAIEASK